MGPGKQECVQVRLTCAEGSSILILAQNGSLPSSTPGASAVDKVRQALVRTGFEDAVPIQVECTELEARFLAHCREA